MTRRIIYKEVQDQKKWWVKILLIVGNGLALGHIGYGLYAQMVLGRPFGNEPMSNNALLWNALLILVILFVVDWIFFTSKLETEIDTESVQFRLPPLIRKFRIFYKRDIESWEVRNYKPIKEFGGWGVMRKRLRFRMKQNRKNTGHSETFLHKVTTRSMAYTMNGNLGLQLYLKNGREVLIGMQRRDAIEKAMKRLMEE